MRRLIPALTFFALAASAQNASVLNPSRGMPAPAGAYPYGNILFPGGIQTNQSHAARLGGVVAGRPYPGFAPGIRPGGGPYPGGGLHPGQVGRARTIVVPYAVPVYYGGDYGYGGYGYQQQAQPNVTVVVPQQPAPSVVINHNYTPDSPKPVLRDYSNTDLPKSGIQVFEGPKSTTESQPAAAPEKLQTRSSDRPTIYLIALKDSTVRQAIGYWVEDGTLHYVTPQSSINHVTLDQVDREMSEQLNSERKLEFDLKTKR